MFSLISSIIMMMVITANSLSPLKMSLYLTLFSVIISFSSYSFTSSVFIACGVIISFSSGMMILFSYCSMMANYKNKSNMSKKFFYTFFILMFTMIFCITPSSMSLSLNFPSLMTTKTYVLIFMMMVVIISMISMNKTFFKPTKKLMNSY